MVKKPTYEELEQKVEKLKNEAFERKQAEDALRESEERLRTITDTALDSIFCKGINRRYTFVNPSMLQLIDCTKEDLIGKVPEEVFDKEDAAIVNEVDERTLNGENISEVRSLSIAGKPYTFHTIQVPLRDSEGNITGISGIVRDITDFVQAQEALRESEEKYRQLFATESDAIIVFDAETRDFLDVNDAALDLYGYTREEFLKLNHLDITTEPEASDSSIKLALEGKLTKIPLRYHKKRDGTIFPVEISASSFTLRNRKAICGAIRDITNRKQVAEKFRLVSSSLLTAQERERKRISLELHDEVGQSLVVLKLQLRSIQRRLEEAQTELRSDCQVMLDYTVGLIENIRRICKDLTPGILDDLGLTAGIRWLAENVLESHDIDTSLDITNIDKLLTNEEQLLIFRIFQEAFTNIVRHSLASHASIVIKKQGGEISLVIEDDGKGFDVKEAMGRDFTERGMGLAAMEERAWMLGGSINIWSQRESGTRIEFRVPTE